jgi:hypothetical protein
MRRACKAHVERHFCKRTHLPGDGSPHSSRSRALPTPHTDPPALSLRAEKKQLYPAPLPTATSPASPLTPRGLPNSHCFLLPSPAASPSGSERTSNLPPPPSSLASYPPPRQPTPSPVTSAAGSAISDRRLARPEHFTGWAVSKKTRGFRVEKILPMTVPWDVSDLSFRAGPRRGPSAHFTL